MNTYSIYQVKNAYIHRYGFRDLPQILGPGRASDPDPGEPLPALPREAWELVYSYETAMRPSLDTIFRIFNRQDGVRFEGCPPQNFKGRSMSVSDVVQTPDGALWYCAPIGWRRVQWRSN